MPRIAGNEHPYLYTSAITLAVLVLVVGISLLRGLDPEAAGRRAGMVPAAGIVLAIWARQTFARWHWRGFAWRFVACWIAVTIFGAFCGLPTPTQ